MPLLYKARALLIRSDYVAFVDITTNAIYFVSTLRKTENLKPQFLTTPKLIEPTQVSNTHDRVNQ